MASPAIQFITQNYKKPYRRVEPATTQAVARGSESRSIEQYDEFIWALAKKFTNSAEEAEAAVVEMKNDIQQCAETGMIVRETEDRLVAQIAWRRLLNFLR